MTPVPASTIFGPLFGDADVARLWSEEAYVRGLVAVEIELARAEARLGLIPASAAEQIGQIQAEQIDLEALARGTLRSGFPVIALVDELRRLAGPDAAPYVHWGATTQDIMDTVNVLQIRSTCKLFKIRIGAIAHHLGELCARHRATVMAGRTHGQQAVPVTLGLKVAGWLAPIVRHAQRLDEMLPRLLVVEFGAPGTLSAFGGKGLALGQALALGLDLNAPLMPWHSQRDAFAEFAAWLSLVTGSLGKMAQDIILLSQTEVHEVAESAEAGRGGSSTMPQKNNPVTSELILAAARTNASLLSAMHHALIQEHERGTHGWQVEWLTLPQMAILTGGALNHATNLSKNLQVDAAAMRANIVRGNDFILAEAAVFALVKAAMPRAKANELVKKACGVAATEGKPLIDVVQEFIGNTLPDGMVDWQALTRPENYLGETEQIIDAVLREARKLV